LKLLLMIDTRRMMNISWNEYAYVLRTLQLDLGEYIFQW
jgi:hypothetical protein